KEADDKIKEGTLNLDDGTDAMTVVFGKEKGGPGSIKWEQAYMMCQSRTLFTNSRLLQTLTSKV
nr:hypothetical protein [Tanacetum cinerariifolium]